MLVLLQGMSYRFTCRITREPVSSSRSKVASTTKYVQAGGQRVLDVAASLDGGRAFVNPQDSVVLLCTVNGPVPETGEEYVYAWERVHQDATDTQSLASITDIIDQEVNSASNSELHILPGTLLGGVTHTFRCSVRI